MDFAKVNCRNNEVNEAFWKTRLGVCSRDCLRESRFEVENCSENGGPIV
jgi:hypothetical protein